LMCIRRETRVPAAELSVRGVCPSAECPAHIAVDNSPDGVNTTETSLLHLRYQQDTIKAPMRARFGRVQPVQTGRTQQRASARMAPPLDASRSEKRNRCRHM
jgi:hypothetical protein